jgi:predicted nucleic acid-binding protein
MPKIVISDTSTLIILQKIEQLDLLQKLYIELVTTPEIAEEYGEELPNWIKVESVNDKKYQMLLETQVNNRRGKCNCISKRI